MPLFPQFTTVCNIIYIILIQPLCISNIIVYFSLRAFQSKLMAFAHYYIFTRLCIIKTLSFEMDSQGLFVVVTSLACIYSNVLSETSDKEWFIETNNKSIEHRCGNALPKAFTIAELLIESPWEEQSIDAAYTRHPSQVILHRCQESGTCVHVKSPPGTSCYADKVEMTNLWFKCKHMNGSQIYEFIRAINHTQCACRK